MFTRIRPWLTRGTAAAFIAGAAVLAGAACSDFLAGPADGPAHLSVSFARAPGETAADSSAGFDGVDRLRLTLRRDGALVVDTTFAVTLDGTVVRYGMRVEMEEPEAEVQLDVALLWQGTPRFVGSAQVRLVRGALNVADVQLQPASGTGTLRVNVANAVTGQPLSGATVVVRAGASAPATGPVTATGTTSATGSLQFSALPVGPYTVFVSAPPLIPVVIPGVVVAATREAVQQVALSPVLAAGETRIVLTWGASPRDLDSHLTGPDGAGGMFHVYYGDRESRANPTSALADVELDTDSTDGYGPETITIRRQFAGPYCYSVHNFSGSPALGTSGAQVRVYRGSQQLAAYTVPATSDVAWTVFQLEGSTVTPLNTTGDDVPGACLPVDPGGMP